MLPVHRRATRAAAVSIVPEPFRIPAFRAFWLARLSSTIAQMAMIIVIGWQVYDISRDPAGLNLGIRTAALNLGIIGLVQFVPLFVLTLVSGWTADRIDRRWIARAAVALELLCALALAWFAWTHTTTLAALFAVAALLGVARAFAGPALGALAPNLVPRRILPNAIALSSIAWQSGAIAGPGSGRLSLCVAPGRCLMPVAALLFAVAIAALMVIGPVQRPEAMTKHPWSQMVDGLRYVRRNRLVLGAITLDLFAVLLGGATAMLPVFARDMLHAGPEGLGHLRAAPAIGATLTAVFFAIRPLKTNVGVKMLVAVGVFGLATIVFGFSRSMPLSLACSRCSARPTCSRSTSASR